MPGSDTPSYFQNYPPFAANAESAPVPAGYSKSFSNLRATVSKAGYIGYFTLGSYDTLGCAGHCSSTPGCGGFNVYIERSVGQIPGGTCLNPERRAQYLCSLWNGGVDAKEAVGTAANRGTSAEAVVAGSNGYSKVV